MNLFVYDTRLRQGGIHSYRMKGLTALWDPFPHHHLFLKSAYEGNGELNRLGMRECQAGTEKLAKFMACAFTLDKKAQHPTVGTWHGNMLIHDFSLYRAKAACQCV